MNESDRHDGEIRREAAVDAIRSYLECAERTGARLENDPEQTARKAIEWAVAWMPELIEPPWSKYVLACACLAVLLVAREDIPELPDCYASALEAMLRLGDLQRQDLTWEELGVLDLGWRTLLKVCASDWLH